MFVSPQSVWGSFWKDGHWGYKCCHQLVKEAYCTGEAGIEAAEVRRTTGLVDFCLANETSSIVLLC